MSKPNMTAVPVSQEGDKSDWKIKTASNGLLFYFNTKSKRSQWDKPDVLKTPEEKLNSTDWQEHTTADGKVFYYNPKLKQSVWRMPPELKAVKEKQAELRKQMAQSDTQAPASSRISVSFTSSIPVAEEPEDDSKRYDNLPHEEAVRIFMELLRDKVSPTMKWEQAQQLIKSDDRVRVIKGFSEQRKLFKDWINQTRVQERQEYKQRVQRARENFRQMLDEKKVLDSDSKYYKVFHLFMNDPRWKALEDREREQTFQEHLDDLFEKERDDNIGKTKHYREELKKILTSDREITPLTKWDDICEKYKDRVVWVELNEYDRLQVFSKWIIELDRLEYEEKRKGKRSQERKNREAFRDLLKEHLDKDTLTHKTKWRHFVQLIKEDTRLFNMLGQNGSSPRELFEDQLEVLKDQYKRTKEDLKKVLKDTSFKVTPETKFEEYDSKFKGHAEYDALDQKTKEYFFNYYVEKAKTKEKENQKKYKRLLRKYSKFLKNTLEIKPESEYKTFEKEINENEQFKNIKEADKISLFGALMNDLKNLDEGQISDEGGDKGRKRKKKNKRKNKKKNNSSEDERGRDSSDESKRSDSKSPSRSRSRDNKKRSRKDKKKDEKRSRSGSDNESDAEKQPDKKVFTEKDQSNQPQSQPQPQAQIQPQPQPQPQSAPQPSTQPGLQSHIQPEKPASPQATVQPNANPMDIEKTSKPNVETFPAKEEQKEAQSITEATKGANESNKKEPELPDASKQIEEGQITVEKKGTVKEDQEEREEGETKESLPRKKSVSKSSRSRSHSRSESKGRERHRKKKERKHSKKKSRKGDKKSKKKHRKRSYTPSESSDDD